MKFLVGLFRMLLKFGMPAYLLLVPVVAVYDWMSPWPPASTGLAQYSDQSAILVGASYQSRYSTQSQYVRSSRSYIIVPSVLDDPKIVTFAQENGQATTAVESRSGFWFLLAWLFACGIGTWWLWFRRVPPNNSFKPKPLRGSA